MRFLRKFFLLTAFFTMTPLMFLSCLLFYLYVSYQNNPQKTNSFFSGTSTVAYAALPTAENVFEAEAVPLDAREESVRQFLTKYDSPLKPYAHEIIDAADRYGIDYRLIPAIAMQESNLCKKIAANSDHNCWGFGIYGKVRTSFISFAEGIETVSAGLSKYKSDGLSTPEQIMSRYTPSSDGSWADGVTHFMDQI